MRFLEKLILIGASILAIVIGTGIAILVTKAIDEAEIKACFDYKKIEFCEKINHEQIKEEND